MIRSIQDQLTEDGGLRTVYRHHSTFRKGPIRHQFIAMEGHLTLHVVLHDVNVRRVEIIEREDARRFIRQGLIGYRYMTDELQPNFLDVKLDDDDRVAPVTRQYDVTLSRVVNVEARHETEAVRKAKEIMEEAWSVPGMFWTGWSSHVLE